MWDEAHARWLVVGCAEAEAALKSPHLSVRTVGQRIDAARYGPVIETVAGFMTRMDGADHARIRTLVLKAFTPAAVAKMHDVVLARVDRLIDRFAGEGRAELVSALAQALPLGVIGQMLGIDEADVGRVKAWAEALGGIADRDPDTAILDRALAAVEEERAYVAALVADHRAQPRDNLLSGLIEAEDQGSRLNERELAAIIEVMMIAGHETTTGLIANGLHLLLTRPEVVSALKADAAAAIEEMLRLESPVQVRQRRVTAAFELGGQALQADQMLYVLLGAANRDPARFVDPSSFDASRKPNHHVAFGEGVHYCIGAPLARLEARLALTRLMERLPDVRLAPGAQLERAPNFTLRSWKALPVEFSSPLLEEKP